MLEIDGEFFENPVELANKKRYLDMVILQSRIYVLQMQLHILEYTPIFHNNTTGGEACNVS